MENIQTSIYPMRIKFPSAVGSQFRRLRLAEHLEKHSYHKGELAVNIRTRGFLIFLGFGSLFALIVFWFAYPQFYPFSHRPAGIAAATLIGAPGAFAAVGLIEFASGQPFHQLEVIWKNLKWWQRGIFGTLFILFGGAIMISVIALALI